MKNLKYISLVILLVQVASASTLETMLDDSEPFPISTEVVKNHQKRTAHYQEKWKSLTDRFSASPRRSESLLPNSADQETQVFKAYALNFLINLRRFVRQQEDLVLPAFPELPELSEVLKTQDLLEWLNVRQDYLAKKEAFDRNLMPILESNDQIKQLIRWLNLSKIPHGSDVIYQGCSEDILKRSLRLSKILGNLTPQSIEEHRGCFDAAQPCSSEKCLLIHLVQNHKMTRRNVKAHTQKMLVRGAYYSAPLMSLDHADVFAFKDVQVYHTKLLNCVIETLEKFIGYKNKFYEKCGLDSLMYKTNSVTTQNLILWGNDYVKLEEMTLDELQHLHFKFIWKLSREVLLENLVTASVPEKIKTPKTNLLRHHLLARIRMLEVEKAVLKNRVNDQYNILLPLSSTLENNSSCLSEADRDGHRKRLKALRALLNEPDLCMLGNLGNESCGPHCLIEKLDPFWNKKNLADYEAALCAQVHFYRSAENLKISASKPIPLFAKNFLTDEIGRFYTAHLRFFQNLGYRVSQDELPVFLDVSYSMVQEDGTVRSFTGPLVNVPDDQRPELTSLAHDNRRLLEMLNSVMKTSQKSRTKPAPDMSTLASLAPRNLAECRAMLAGFEQKCQEAVAKLLDFDFKVRKVENRREVFNKSKLSNPYFGRVEGASFAHLLFMGIVPDDLNQDLRGLTQYLNFVKRYYLLVKYVLDVKSVDVAASQSHEAGALNTVASGNEGQKDAAKPTETWSDVIEQTGVDLKTNRKAKLVVKQSKKVLSQIQRAEKLVAEGTSKEEAIRELEGVEKHLQHRLKVADTKSDSGDIALMRVQLDALSNLRSHLQTEIDAEWKNTQNSADAAQNSSAVQTSNSTSTTASTSVTALATSEDTGQSAEPFPAKPGNDETASLDPVTPQQTISPAVTPVPTIPDPSSPPIVVKEADKNQLPAKPGEESQSWEIQAPSAPQQTISPAVTPVPTIPDPSSPPIVLKEADKNQLPAKPGEEAQSWEIQAPSAPKNTVSGSIKAPEPNYAPFANKHWQNRHKHKQHDKRSDDQDNTRQPIFKKQPLLTTAALRLQVKDAHIPKQGDADQAWEQEARSGDWRVVPPRFKGSQKTTVPVQSGDFRKSTVVTPTQEVPAVSLSTNSDAPTLNPAFQALFLKTAANKTSWADTTDDDDDNNTQTNAPVVAQVVAQLPVASSSSSATASTHDGTISNKTVDDDDDNNIQTNAPVVVAQVEAQLPVASSSLSATASTHDGTISNDTAVVDVSPQQTENMPQQETNAKPEIVFSTKNMQKSTPTVSRAQPDPTVYMQGFARVLVQDFYADPNTIPVNFPDAGPEFYPAAYCEDLPTSPDALRVALIRSRAREDIVSQRAHEVSSENLLLRQQLDTLNQSLLKQDHDLQKSRGEQVKLAVEKLRLQKTLSELLAEFVKDRSSDYFDPEKQRSTLDAPDSRD